MALQAHTGVDRLAGGLPRGEQLGTVYSLAGDTAISSSWGSALRCSAIRRFVDRTVVILRISMIARPEVEVILV